MNLYEILEVSRNASQEVIQKAYKALLLKYHPDVVQAEYREQAEEYVKHLNYAYSVLSNDGLRRQYDIELKQHENPTQSSKPETSNKLKEVLYKMPNWLRWILALPISIVFYLLVYAVSVLSINYYVGLSGTWINALFQAIISIPLVVLIFNEIVPTHKTVASGILCVLISSIYILAGCVAFTYDNYLNNSPSFTVVVYAIALASAIITIKTVIKINKDREM